MFKPKIFAEDNLDILQEFIRKHPLGLVVTTDKDNSIHANLIPMSLITNHEKGILRCHFAKSNTQLESLKAINEVLIVFTGSQGYISPELYHTKKVHGKAVPTWNYSMVQVRGVPQIITDSRWLLDHITDMTNDLEANNPKPWKVSDAPEEYIQSQLSSIVGVEISIRQIEGKFKVSQNHPDENRKGVENHFRQIGDEEMANYVATRGATSSTNKA